MRHAGNCDPYTGKRRQQKLPLRGSRYQTVGRDLKAAIIRMFKDIKEPHLEVNKDVMMSIKQRILIKMFYKEIIKKNQLEILQLKFIITEV